MMLNCDPALFGDPMVGCRGKLAPTPLPVVSIPTATHNWGSIFTERPYFRFPRYVGRKDSCERADGSHLPPSTPLRLIKIGLRFTNTHGFSSRAPGKSDNKNEESQSDHGFQIPRRRRVPIIPQDPELDVAVVDCYLNKHIWSLRGESFCRSAVVEIPGHEEGGGGGGTRYVMLKHYTPYDVYVARSHRNLLKPEEEDAMREYEYLSAFQAETAVYHNAPHLQGRVIPYHLGYYTLRENLDAKGKITELSADRVSKIVRKYGLFAAFELIPGRTLDNFHAMGNSGLGLNTPDDDCLRFRNDLGLGNAFFGSLKTLREENIGYNQVKGSATWVYPVFHAQRMRECDGTINTIRYTEYVVVLTGFERSTTVDERMIKFNRDVNRGDMMVAGWEAGGWTPV